MFRFYCWFYLWNTTFLKNQFLSSYMYITSNVKITSNFISNNHHSRSGKFTSYFKSISLWPKFNTVPILVFPLRSLQNFHDFCLNWRHLNWIIHFIKFCIFTSVRPIKSEFLAPYKVQPVPIAFHKTWPISFSYSRFTI